MALGPEHHRRLRRPARPGLRRVLRDRRATRWAGSAPASSRTPRRRGHPHPRQRVPRRTCRASTSTSSHPACSRSSRRDRGHAHRPADAAPARRLHRDRDARVRRDHRPLRDQRRRDHVGFGTKLTAGRQGITPVDKIDLPVHGPVHLAEPQTVVLDRARAGVRRAVRELPAARLAPRAAPGSRCARTRSRPSSMGIPLVKTKLLAYAHRRGVRRHVRRVPRLLPQHGQRRPVPVLVLDLRARDGDPRRPGSIWGVVVGAIVLSFINNRLIPDVLNSVPGELGLDFDLTELSFGSSASCW